MKKIGALIIIAWSILIYVTPALADSARDIKNSGTAFVIGAGLMILGMIGNRRFLKR